MPLQPQPAENPVSLADLGVVEQDAPREEGELTPNEQAMLKEATAEISDTALDDEEKRMLTLVDSIEATEEQKKELRHEIQFFFFGTAIETAFMTLAMFQVGSKELAELSRISPPIAVAMLIIMSYIIPAIGLKFSQYGEAKQNLHDAEQRLMDVANLVGITGGTRKETIAKATDTAAAFEQKKRVEHLAVEIASKKKKRDETSE